MPAAPAHATPTASAALAFAFAGFTLGALVFAPMSAPRPHAPPQSEESALRFELVAYEIAPDGAAHAETLDSELSLGDCAFALGAAVRLDIERAELVTCERQQ